MRQTEKALRYFANPAVNRDKAIHQIRRCFKRIRSLLRLARPALSRKVYQRENRYYRNAGRHLACLREAGALLQTLDRLSQFHDTHAQLTTVLTELRRALQSAHALAALHAERLMHSEAETLRRAQARIADWSIKFDSSGLPEGVFATYARGRACMLKTKRKAHSADFHAWRKQARYLHEHLKFLKSFLPPWLTPFADELKELEGYLSELQDLAVLQQWLLQLVAQGLWQIEPLEPLLQFLHNRQSVLHALVKPLGEQLYGLPPAAFRKKLTASPVA